MVVQCKRAALLGHPHLMKQIIQLGPQVLIHSSADSEIDPEAVTEGSDQFRFGTDKRLDRSETVIVPQVTDIEAGGYHLKLPSTTEVGIPVARAFQIESAVFQAEIIGQRPAFG